MVLQFEEGRALGGGLDLMYVAAVPGLLRGRCQNLKRPTRPLS